MEARQGRRYETVFIVPPTLGEDEVEKVIADVKDSFASRGATVHLIEKWGRKKLAYPVSKHEEAWYVMFHVEGGGDAVQEAERRMRISDNVLRYLTVRIDNVAGAMDSAAERLARRARQDEERAARAAERAQQQAREEETESARRSASRAVAVDDEPADDEE